MGRELIMRVVFRVDASLQIGTGHVMRCLTLAEALKEKGAEVTFICREHKGNLLARIEQQGFKTHSLPANIVKKNDIEKSKRTERENLYGLQWLGNTQQQDAEQCGVILEKIKPDWLIVDHYSLDHIWQSLVTEHYNKLMVIDDLADRKHISDLLLDQTYGRKKIDYVGCVPRNCQMLLGSQYALLRAEFSQWREYSLERRVNQDFKKLLITMGGVDPDNITEQILKVLKNCKLPPELEIIVIMGETAPNIEIVEKQVTEMSYKTQIKTNVNNMAELMANADLAIGAAGATTWERCCLGLPCIQIVIAENQQTIAVNLQEINAIRLLKSIDELGMELNYLANKLLAYSNNSKEITDGSGVKLAVKKLYGQ